MNFTGFCNRYSDVSRHLVWERLCIYDRYDRLMQMEDNNCLYDCHLNLFSRLDVALLNDFDGQQGPFRYFFAPHFISSENWNVTTSPEVIGAKGAAPISST